jgi:hypothetical protein
VEAKPKKRSSSSEGQLQPHLATPVNESSKVIENIRLKQADLAIIEEKAEDLGTGMENIKVLLNNRK